MLILASASPRRRELLKSAGYKFKIIPAESEEIIPEAKPEEAAVLTAKSKALEVSAKHPDDVILAADTIFFISGEIMNKPKDEADAFRMLNILSGARHTVITAVCIIYKNRIRSFFGRTSVEFYKLSEDDIDAYIKTGEPFDKAGAYGIQEKGALLVKGIRGDFYNVMGLPLARTVRELKKFGIEPDI
ncbi:MAG: Maf family protein [Oscillospiraceae bacterium]|jgi:septum formation protein|nr:Maf family protein [Oscillospiraceae bacterium]